MYLHQQITKGRQENTLRRAGRARLALNSTAGAPVPPGLRLVRQLSQPGPAC